jgi:ankyrin repeat protein
MILVPFVSSRLRVSLTMRNLAEHEPLERKVVAAIHGGDVDTLQQMLREYPWLATACIGDPERCRFGAMSRTLLHVATDWPGNYPNVARTIGALVAAGADVNARFTGRHTETPLHWAASSDDVEVAAALIDGGADLEAPGASIAGGGPLGNAVGYGCWHVARLLVQRGARVDSLWQAAALGMLERVQQLLGADPAPTHEELDGAFWQACHGGQLRMAELLLARGADIDAIPGYSDQAPLDVAGGVDTRRGQLVSWLRERGATPAET